MNESDRICGAEFGVSPTSLTLTDSDSQAVLEATWRPAGLAPASWRAAGGGSCSSSFDRYSAAWCHKLEGEVQYTFYLQLWPSHDYPVWSSY